MEPGQKEKNVTQCPGHLPQDRAKLLLTQRESLWHLTAAWLAFLLSRVSFPFLSPILSPLNCNLNQCPKGVEEAVIPDKCLSFHCFPGSLGVQDTRTRVCFLCGQLKWMEIKKTTTSRWFLLDFRLSPARKLSGEKWTEIISI